MKRKKLLLPVFLILVLNGCAGYKYSNISDGERVVMKIREAPVLDFQQLEAQNPAAQEDALGFTFISLLGKAMPLAIGGIKKLVQSSKEKYTAQYETGRSYLYFYSNISTKGPMDPSNMQFDGLDIIRTVTLNQGITDTALLLSLEVDKSNPYEIINNSIFKLKVKDFRLNYCKAKVSKKHKTLNLNVDLKIFADWVDKSGQQFQNKEVGNFSLTLEDIPLKKEDKNYDKFYKNIKGRFLKGQSTIIPRTASYYYDGHDLASAYGQGIYHVKAKITETGDESFVMKYLPMGE